MQEYKFIDVEHHIPLYVSGFGPKAQAVAGEYGDGEAQGWATRH